MTGDRVEALDDASDGRMLAFRALQRLEEHGQFIQDSLLVLAPAGSSVRSQERALAVDVASGTVRRRSTLDALLQNVITRPAEKVERDLWLLLRLGAWQVVFGRMPDHAAVDTTVRMCQALGQPRWTGFVNGVLRNLLRLLTADFVDQPAEDAVPLDNGAYRRLNRSVFPSPETSRVAYASVGFALPAELAKRWAERFEGDDLWQLCRQTLLPPTISIRVNSLRSDVESVREALLGAGVRVSAATVPAGAISARAVSGVAVPNCLRLEDSGRIDRLPGFSDGCWSIQDEAAMQAALLLAPQPGETILDLCAAPGGKTTHLAELSQDKARIFACDVNRRRIEQIQQSVERLKLTSVTVTQISRDGRGIPDHSYDAVLVDVPCSNTGVLNRRPEARWRFSEEAIADLTDQQVTLLIRAMQRVRPGGRVVYSTCSIEPDENQAVVQAALRFVRGFALASEQFFLPGQPADGAYQALLVKRDQ
ncbi:MAG: hypothetical protein KDA96_08765 [Planctomycetaceae bacterium]|nr:hypothetical protein [Planctomycetaceae bacterium]